MPSGSGKQCWLAPQTGPGFIGSQSLGPPEDDETLPLELVEPDDELELGPEVELVEPEPVVVEPDPVVDVPEPVVVAPDVSPLVVPPLLVVPVTPVGPAPPLPPVTLPPSPPAVSPTKSEPFAQWTTAKAAAAASKR